MLLLVLCYRCFAALSLSAAAFGYCCCWCAVAVAVAVAALLQARDMVVQAYRKVNVDLCSIKFELKRGRCLLRCVHAHGQTTTKVCSFLQPSLASLLQPTLPTPLVLFPISSCPWFPFARPRSPPFLPSSLLPEQGKATHTLYRLYLLREAAEGAVQEAQVQCPR